MATRQLSTTQRVAIRAIADGRWDEVTGVTRRALVKRGLVEYTPECKLTAAGRGVHERILGSGDGPEDLKAMFRFGGAR